MPETRDRDSAMWANRIYNRTYATLVLLAISVNLPGRVSPDGVDMLWQAREPASLADWHSPFVTFAFSLLAPIFGSPTGALILQSVPLMTWPALLFARSLGLKAPQSQRRRLSSPCPVSARSSSRWQGK